MMKVNVNNELSEKQTKQLISSFKRLIAYIVLEFNKDNKNNNKSFVIKFDNDEYLQINTLKGKNNYIYNYGYYNKYDELKENIPIQAIENINKYSLNVIEILKRHEKNYILNGFYTKQEIVDFPIFKEKDTGLEQKLKNIHINIEAENIIEEDSEFEI